MEDFFNFLRTELRYSPHTLTSYQHDLRQFSAYVASAFELTDLAEAKYPVIRGWIVELMTDGLDASSVNRKVACLRSYYKFLLRNGRIAVNPMLRVKAPKMAKKLPEFVPEEALNGLLNSFEFTTDFAGARDQLVLEMLYGTGIRLSELIGITTGDVSLWHQTVRVVGKGNKQRIVPLNPSLMQVLKQYLDRRSHTFGATDSEQAALFLTNKGEPLYEKFVYRTVKRYLSEITTSVAQQHPHTLRHAFATHLLNKGADLNSIKELLGHSSLASTQVYTNLSVDRLKSVFEQAHPRA
jgi:integrase/recombinase XerC